MIRFTSSLLIIFSVLLLNTTYAQKIILGSESVGIASYYGKEFYGNKTSSGETLLEDKMTCAHPSLPFGTMLEVTNLDNSKFVVVRVNDRGPHVKGRIIDVTHAAARVLGMFGDGLMKVKVMIVGEKGTTLISRPQPIITDSTEFFKNKNSEKVDIPYKNKPDSTVDLQYKKKLASKRADRRNNR